MKKLMLLGGIRYLIPIIEKAHELGCYVITCDYIPDNIAHKYSDEYCNVSIIDKEAVLKKAQEYKIDGIMSFACDPGVETAAYVAEKMGLPFQGPYESVKILQDKGLFRKFLTDNGFNCPKSKRYTDKDKPFDDIDYFNWPVIVKPVDSAGSKGITKVEKVEDLASAIDIALDGAHNGAFIIEDFITFDGYHSSADLFTVDGKLKFVAYSDHFFDSKALNSFVPAVNIWPTTMKKEHQDYLTAELQRLMNLLKMKTGIYNVETCVGTDGKPYIMEVSPRGGGCKIAELQNLAFGVDLLDAEVKNILGLPFDEIIQKECNGNWCIMVIHANIEKAGIFEELVIDEKIKKNNVKMIDMSVVSGDIIEPFTGANKSLGDMFLKFDSREELEEVVNNSDKWLKIKTK